MRWKWQRKPGRTMSLRQRLLWCLLPLTLLITAAELWSTHREALAAANSAYDRSIRGALKAIEANISTASGGLAVELPYRLFELLELTATGHVYFRVASRDGLVEVGNLDLPVPEGRLLQPGVPVFSDADYLGERVRMGALLTHVRLQGDAGPVTPVVIQVAEQALSREQSAAQFVRTSLVRAIVVLLALIGIVVGVVSWVLRPFRRLEAEVRQRHPADVSPLDAPDLPRDVQPLVQAVNTQMARRQALADQQRQFLDDASHQLRTPLTTLRTQADYALRLLPDPSQPMGDPEQAGELRDSLQAIVDQIDAATRSTNQLLSLARSDATEPHWADFDLAELLRQAVRPLLMRARQRRIDLGVEGPDELPAQGDATLWREALSNLLDNALRYGHAGTPVTASAHRVEGVRPGWAITVISEGDPVPEALFRQLSGEGAGTGPDAGPDAGRFVRGQGARRGGAGLGLAIARRIAQRHGGELTIDARATGTFAVTLSWPEPRRAPGRDRALGFVPG